MTEHIPITDAGYSCSSHIFFRLLAIVGDAARQGTLLNHKAVGTALSLLRGQFSSPRTICATPGGTLIARWSESESVEIGPGWYKICGPLLEREAQTRMSASVRSRTSGLPYKKKPGGEPTTDAT